MTEFLTQLIYSVSRPVAYVIADGDVVEEANLSRQKFIPADIGRFKAEVLAERYGKAHGLNIGYSTEYCESIDQLESLFYGAWITPRPTLPILIGCVDNNKSRAVMHRYFKRVNTLLYLDVGNEEYVGQLIVGFKLDGRQILKPVGDVFPEVLNDDSKFKSEESCAERSYHAPQNVATNIQSALAAFSVLNSLLTNNEILVSRVNYNSQVCYARPELTSEDEVGEAV
ncbi:MAG: ThiF family adenylyltransferase [Thermosipho sp. (in: Bacteria)]|nr:ThiF family adenylyltransferase [Thermosipho sp. (in: thermotogales)]